MCTDNVAVIKPMRWYSSWYEQKPARLRQEQEAMKTRFPSFSLVRGDDGKLGWVGTLTSNRNHKYKVLIDYPDNFPHEEPSAYILSPRFTSQHMWKDGHLCLMYPDGSTWQTNTTCATILAIVAAWIFAYEQHKAKCKRNEGKPCMDPKCPHWPGDKM
jgi:ubiquitin-protein ligase